MLLSLALPRRLPLPSEFSASVVLPVYFYPLTKDFPPGPLSISTAYDARGSLPPFGFSLELCIRRIVHQKSQESPSSKQCSLSCMICDCIFPSKRSLTIHKESRPHKRTVQRLKDLKNNLRCSICDISLTSSHNYSAHNKGLRHLSMLRNSGNLLN